jgi:hypothetical protein
MGCMLSDKKKNLLLILFAIVGIIILAAIVAFAVFVLILDDYLSF